MRSLVVILCLGACLWACSGRTPGTPQGSSDAGLDGGVGDAALPFDCAQWTSDLAAANRFDINRLALGISLDVVEGTLDQVRQQGDEHFVSLHVEHVWHGKSFLVGHDTWVPMDALAAASLELPGSYVVGFRGNNFPLFDDDLQDSVWFHPTALVPSEEREDYGGLIGYQSGQISMVAVVRISSQDADRTWFEVLEPLRGDFPPVFGANWSASNYPVTFPTPSNTEYIASVSGLSEYGGQWIGSVLDFRDHTPDSRALVVADFAAPAQFWAPDALAQAEGYGLGWSYHSAPHVLGTTVSGLADECCTGAGGTFVAHDILEVLQGITARAFTVTGGHAYYGPEVCGDGYLLAVHGLDGVGGFDPAELTCDPMGVIDASGDFTLATRVLQLDDTVDNRQRVAQWLASAPPVFRLHPPDEPVPLEHVSQDAPTALWSVPVKAELALLATSNLSWISIDEVDYFEESDHYEVTFTTTFSESRLEHQTLYRAKMAFRCGDPRLLQEGADWLAPILFDGGLQEPFDYGRGFVIPGLLLPNYSRLRQVASAAAYEIQ